MSGDDERWCSWRLQRFTGSTSSLRKRRSMKESFPGTKSRSNMTTKCFHMCRLLIGVDEDVQRRRVDREETEGWERSEETGSEVERTHCRGSLEHCGKPPVPVSSSADTWRHEDTAIVICDAQYEDRNLHVIIYFFYLLGLTVITLQSRREAAKIWRSTRFFMFF